MHFVIGGAFNGKRKWVASQLDEAPFQEISEPGKSLDDGVNNILSTDLEHWIFKQFGHDSDEVVQTWKQEVDRLIEWENGHPDRRVVIIGTDQSKGIVPIEKEQRFTRDILGWCHQYSALKAERVTRVWYGIAEELKTKEELR
ncbi:bifunctional adenosylcobinamide kinase/adenosylcobinamide-phosphate guanylyltransferase [Jeotgalibacillus haloalkalitolerans]|uniref:Bifunctional adenosylcobinamide kinase/adenosylcobinamide-phosphate guanylyltransferase n=1 Tax=Jeotgalibacillus haloalkalitolerans TaxID=3104292 RepID=A0ABU5KKB5_9BACL|nr:bifunctional adenosylcobinamide kinase/adenosylcobinamide-phosphate guanylyltransferase [Jeotgalibacillus sp. HH7-29]MDZ5711196.1 bifunctional adenosylcobinamide kinase/adenosylcobinamide-phosphate guanylyltransferase [Jeotgalibacillus sp. HH7-29]